MFGRSLQAKVVFTFLLFMFVMTALLLLNQRLFLLPVFSQLEEEFARRDLERVFQTIIQERASLESTSFDWSAWDDTYEYVTNPNAEYEQANLDYATLDNLRVDLMFFYDRAGNPVWGRGFDRASANRIHFLDFPADAPSTLKSRIWFSDESPSDAYHSGMMLTEHGVLLLAARPILTSARDGPWRGVLVMGRLLTGSTLERLRQAAGAPFEFVAADQLSAESVRMLSKFSDFSSTLVYELDKDRLESLRSVEDIWGESNLVIRNQVSREIFGAAFQSLRKSFWLVVGSLLTLMLALMAMIHVKVAKPVVSLSRHLNDMRVSGNYTRLFHYRSKDEVGRLAQRFNDLLAQIAEHSNELRDLSYEDSLTQIANRRCFNDRLILRWEEAIRTGQPMALILCDIDYFKRFNDLYGHLVGDECLREVAQTLKRTANKKLDLVARFGGEEFVILMPETSPADAVGVAERIRKAVEELQIEHARSPVSRYVSVSIGVAACLAEADYSPEALIRAADVALYEAKSDGRNRIVVDGGGLPSHDQAVG